MRMTKIAAAITLSAGLLVGCNGPELVQEPEVTPPAPTSPLAGGNWQFGDTSGAAAMADSMDLPDVYVFDGKTNQKFYTDFEVPGTYRIYSNDYSDGFESDPQTIDFVYHEINGTTITSTPISGATFTVTGDALVIDSGGSFGELSASDVANNQEVTDAIKAANEASGVNNQVQILDTLTDDVGELRLKLSDSSTGATVSSIASGKLTVDVIYQVDEETEQEADGTGDNAYISLYTNGTSNKNLYGEIILSEGKVKYRGAGVGGVSGGEITETSGTFENGEELAIEVTWGNSEFKFTVNDEEFIGAITEDAAVTVISLKIGDTKNTTNFKFVGDNLTVFSNDTGSEEQVFNDNFDGYATGQVLKGNPYNSSTSEATVIGNGDDTTDPVEPGDFPSAVHEFKFNNGDATTDSGTAASSNTKWTGNATLTSTAGSTGSNATAIDVDQDTAGYGYAYYTADGTTGADQIEGSFSIETVINRDRANASDVALVDYADTSNYLGYKLYIESNDDTLKFKVYGGVVGDSNLSTEAVSSVSIMDDTWYHVAAVYDDVASEATIYLNGELVATKSVDWDLAKNSGDKFILLGGATSSDKNFDGQVDNIGLWNVALTAEQVAERVTQFSAQ
ncbi:hypothetical protein BCU70_20700 [Vibrio sp. 10N.286.49.C2]|nr:hypothetical protein BCU70_20700 [Vibrio sp. 10N.286.49.C2]PMH51224.1 hypothetical protein BCU66_17520 [Vibrio sp. 10N.286.49.B1]PMH82702.1 hypothetical protein BCU58_01935 [Vibrio sp. 10N.286.48.B7]